MKFTSCDEDRKKCESKIQRNTPKHKLKHIVCSDVPHTQQSFSATYHKWNLIKHVFLVSIAFEPNLSKRNQHRHLTWKLWLRPSPWKKEQPSNSNENSDQALKSCMARKVWIKFLKFSFSMLGKHCVEIVGIASVQSMLQEHRCLQVRHWQLTLVEGNESVGDLHIFGHLP